MTVFSTEMSMSPASAPIGRKSPYTSPRGTVHPAPPSPKPVAATGHRAEGEIGIVNGEMNRRMRTEKCINGKAPTPQDNRILADGDRAVCGTPRNDLHASMPPFVSGSTANQRQQCRLRPRIRSDIRSPCPNPVNIRIVFPIVKGADNRAIASYSLHKQKEIEAQRSCLHASMRPLIPGRQGLQRQHRLLRLWRSPNMRSPWCR